MKRKLKLALYILIFFNGLAASAQTGIGTTTPSQRLDVANGNVRIRDINTNVGVGGTDRVVVADASGVLKTLDQGVYTLFHARLKANQNLSIGVITTLVFNTPLATSALYAYNTTTGTLTFNEAGNYLITLQGGFASVPANTQLTLGIRNVPDVPNVYLGRGSHYNAAATSSSIGELMQYTTLIVVPSANYQIRFVAAPNENCTIIATETGSTGSGNVTNVTVQKI